MLKAIERYFKPMLKKGTQGEAEGKGCIFKGFLICTQRPAYSFSSYSRFP